MLIESNLLGVILCGGQSKRMGTDKGLILLNDKPWASLMAEKLTALALPVAISINPLQQDTYTKYFNIEVLIVDDTEIDGPLNGLFSAHQQYPEKDLLLLACDLINMQDGTIKSLINAYKENPGNDFYAYHNGNFWEPLCAIYTSAGLQGIKDTQELSDYSFQHVLNTGKSLKINLTDDSSFENFNTL